MQGTADDNLTPDMAERFCAAYRRAGGDAELETFEGQQHAFVTRHPNSDAATTALAADGSVDQSAYWRALDRRLKTFLRL